MERKSKAKAHKGGLEVTAVVTGADGAQYTICGCSVEEVQAAVEEAKKQPAAGDANQPDIQAGG